MRTAGLGHHVTSFEALPLIMGKQFKEKANYFDACRSKRNLTDYGRVGGVSDSEAAELLTEAKQFREYVLAWLDARASGK